MSSSVAANQPYVASQTNTKYSEQQDPFLSASTSSHHRFSHFDSQLFALGPTASPDQIKRVLESHLAETGRRIQEASRLGITLVQQQKDLAERLKDVEKQQSAGDISPELRQKLVEVEKEYNEVGRESARAFLPKSRVSSAEMGGGSPFPGDKVTHSSNRSLTSANVSQRSISPSKFESQATSSPSKLNVPNRKQRNQPSNRVHDIEFATEISTSLLSQVRHLQALLAGKEESLKTVILEKSRLEIEAEGFSQRLRSLDESEHRYKDENWNLETQIHELLAAAKESADREKRLNNNLSILQSEKSAAQKELDDIRLSYAKLSEDHASALKHHEVEMGSVKRSMTVADIERSALQRRVEDLSGQNQELARAVAHQRGRLEDRVHARGHSDEDYDTAHDNVTPEQSPPPSPTKGTPRHSMLESETLKSSLHHAHRMIQNLKGNIHREKTEKLELKRMLQDARDELDARRGEFGSGNGKRNRKVESKEFKKPLKPGQLGGLRSSKSEIFIEDANWEDDNGQKSPSYAAVSDIRVAVGAGDIFRSADDRDIFGTANDQDTTDAFQTANERGTETEDFQTGVEELSGSDDLTETERPSDTMRSRPKPFALSQMANRNSFQSTASTSGDEYSYEEVKTPTAQQPQRLRLRVSRGQNRRSRAVSEEPPSQSSPASFANSSRNGTPQAAGQSLFAELGNLSDEEDSINGTPSHSNFVSQSVTPESRSSSVKPVLSNTPVLLPSVPAVPRLPMVDSGMMTDAWESAPASPLKTIPLLAGGLPGAALTDGVHLDISNAFIASDTRPLMNTNITLTECEPRRLISDNHTSTEPEPGRVMSDGHTLTDPEPVPVTNDSCTSTSPPVKVKMSDSASQWHEEQMYEQIDNHLTVVEDRSRPISASSYSDRSSQYDPEVMGEKLAKFPSPPTSRADTPLIRLAGLETVSTPLTRSITVYEHTEPPEAKSPTIVSTRRETRPATPPIASTPSQMAFSAIQFVDTEPISPRSPRRDAVIIPREDSIDDVSAAKDLSETLQDSSIGGLLGRNKNTAPATPIIADDTRQSPCGSPAVETPEFQRPFKEISGNPHDRAANEAPVKTIDESSQTALTARQIDEMQHSMRPDTTLADDAFKALSNSSPHGIAIAPALRIRKSQESIGSVSRARPKIAEPDSVNDVLSLLKRPGSAGSGRNSMSSVHPPLPIDHKQVIAAAAQRSGSSSGGVGTMGPSCLPDSTQRSGSSSGGVRSMGPPSLPASAYKNPSLRPRTPSSQPPLSPASMRAGTTPRPIHSSAGTAEIHSPIRTGKSRASSVSSFISEIDTRFNMNSGMPHGLEPGTDPRMINAITQTMIGEYLWKYTRKAGRGAMSDNRHRRYFWVHPYTRTLYWSDRDPSGAGRAELKAKSVPIEAVRVVTDDNPMPPGLHRKSLIIMTPGRSVKFTATTGQRHETWFNALSYLLLRTGEHATEDTASVANGALTREDVDEFNPGLGTRSARRGPASLSSYNSRTTRNESPARTTKILAQPHLALTASSRPSIGTFSRWSNYWKAGEAGKSNSYSSRRSRHSVSDNGGIYEASGVHDSAEDLREQYEKQDRESDRLENVRACCDGKHDVAHLHNHPVKGRHASTIGSASGSRASPTTQNSRKSRNSTLRHTD